MPTATPPQCVNFAEDDPDQHAERVRSWIDRISGGELEKIVLSRRMRFQMGDAINPEAMLRWVMNDAKQGHIAALSPAGGEYADAYLVGASPEVLIRKRGAYISTHPLAGTAPRAADPDEDARLARGLAESEKDLAEHAFVTEQIRQCLEPYCVELNVPDQPTLTQSTHTWHLGTPIVGRVADPKLPSLELARALHPTPAVGGYPTDTAVAALRTDEPDRGFYAGCVGWSDAAGDGEWRVTIRSAVVSGATVTAHTGSGVVADSDPNAEARETITKLGPVRSALGLPRINADDVVLRSH
nr:isochorismate synthase [Corynebacterium sp. TAE3-ERU12]